MDRSDRSAPAGTASRSLLLPSRFCGPDTYPGSSRRKCRNKAFDPARGRDQAEEGLPCPVYQKDLQEFLDALPSAWEQTARIVRNSGRRVPVSSAPEPEKSSLCKACHEKNDQSSAGIRRNPDKGFRQGQNR